MWDAIVGGSFSQFILIKGHKKEEERWIGLRWYGARDCNNDGRW